MITTWKKTNAGICRLSADINNLASGVSFLAGTVPKGLGVAPCMLIGLHPVKRVP